MSVGSRPYKCELLYFVLGILTSFFAVTANADIFIDELLLNPFGLTSYTSSGSVTSTPIQLTLISNSGSGLDARARVYFVGETDSVEVTYAVSSSSSFGGGVAGRLRLFATLFNDTQSGGNNGTDGDMVAGIEILRDELGVLYPRACLWRKISDGSWESSGFFSGSSCTFINVSLAEDQQYSASIGIDRQSGMLTYQLASVTQSYAVTGAANLPSDPMNYVETRLEEVTGQMVGEIYGIQTDVIDAPADGAFNTIPSRYQFQYYVPGEDRFEWNAGTMKMRASTDGTVSERTRMRIVDPSDVLEARLMVNSETDVAGTAGSQRFSGAVAGMFYNDTVNGGFNGLEGDVFATSELVAEPSGGLKAQYCLLRSNSADFATFVGLLNGGQDECVSYALAPAFDTYYDLSVGIDRAANRLLFSVDGETASYDILTSVFTANAGDYQAVRATAFSGSGGGTSVITVDRIETISTVQYCNNEIVTVNIGNGDTPTSGDDVILGTTGNDIISGMGGNDTICGLGGDDDINGGRGTDWIDAGPGDDTVQGANDDDEIYGDTGVDTLFGGPGNDAIYGEEGDDYLKGNSGNDTLEGGSGIDKILGGSGNDTIYTGTGSNIGTTQTVTGGDGDDMMYGGPDADELRGETGEDTIKGGDGNDRLFGGGGEDNIDGEGGNDLVRGNGAADVLRGGIGNDQVDGLGGNDLMYGGDGVDTMNGSTGNDTIHGDAGNDVLNGGGGNDSLDGGADTDDCNGAGGTGDSAIACEIETNIP